MSKDAAFQRASARARSTRQYRYVVWSVEDPDPPGQHYHVASDEDLETFYLGCQIVACYGPDGEYEP